MRFLAKHPVDDELCEFCPLEKEDQGTHCYGGQVHSCEGSRCKEAIEAWEDEQIDWSVKDE